MTRQRMYGILPALTLLIAACEAFRPHPVDQEQFNDRTIIGILSQPGPPADEGGSYIAASYVKWLEAAGARVLPIFYDETREQMVHKFSVINGLLLPGGGARLKKGHPFFDAADFLVKLAIKMGNGFQATGWPAKHMRRLSKEQVAALVGSGKVMAADAYVGMSKDGYNKMEDIMAAVKRSGRRLVVLFEGKRPDEKEKRGGNFTGRPRRGGVVDAIRRALEDAGCLCVVPPREQDWAAAQELANHPGVYSVYIEQDSDMMLVLARLYIMTGSCPSMLLWRPDVQGEFAWWELDVAAMVDSMRVADGPISESARKERLSIYFDLLGTLLPNDFGRPIPGISGHVLADVLLRGVREFGQLWCSMARNGEGLAVVDKVEEFLNSPQLRKVKAGLRIDKVEMLRSAVSSLCPCLAPAAAGGADAAAAAVAAGAAAGAAAAAGGGAAAAGANTGGADAAAAAPGLTTVFTTALLSAADVAIGLQILWTASGTTAGREVPSERTTPADEKLAAAVRILEQCCAPLEVIELLSEAPPPLDWRDQGLPQSLAAAALIAWGMEQNKATRLAGCSTGIIRKRLQGRLAWLWEAMATLRPADPPRRRDRSASPAPAKRVRTSSTAGGGAAAADGATVAGDSSSGGESEGSSSDDDGDDDDGSSSDGSDGGGSGSGGPGSGGGSSEEEAAVPPAFRAASTFGMQLLLNAIKLLHELGQTQPEWTEATAAAITAARLLQPPVGWPARSRYKPEGLAACIMLWCHGELLKSKAAAAQLLGVQPNIFRQTAQREGLQWLRAQLQQPGSGGGESGDDEEFASASARGAEALRGALKILKSAGQAAEPAVAADIAAATQLARQLQPPAGWPGVGAPTKPKSIAATVLVCGAGMAHAAVVDLLGINATGLDDSLRRQGLQWLRTQLWASRGVPESHMAAHPSCVHALLAAEGVLRSTGAAHPEWAEQIVAVAARVRQLQPPADTRIDHTPETVAAAALAWCGMVSAPKAQQLVGGGAVRLNVSKSEKYAWLRTQLEAQHSD